MDYFFKKTVNVTIIKFVFGKEMNGENCVQNTMMISTDSQLFGLSNAAYTFMKVASNSPITDGKIIGQVFY